MNVIQHFNRATTTDALIDADLDGIGIAYVEGFLKSDDAVQEWINRGVQKFTAFRWLDQARRSMK